MRTQGPTYRFFITACLFFLAILIAGSEVMNMRDAGTKFHNHWVVMEFNDVCDDERWMPQELQDEEQPPFIHGPSDVSWNALEGSVKWDRAAIWGFNPDFGLLYLENRCLRL